MNTFLATLFLYVLFFIEKMVTATFCAAVAVAYLSKTSYADAVVFIDVAVVSFAALTLHDMLLGAFWIFDVPQNASAQDKIKFLAAKCARRFLNIVVGAPILIVFYFAVLHI